ncbi:N-acetylmuramoyl-L-alanine amidase [Corynebacterium sp.]|uniref:N-acetylmuramoyl-L-alanine amidase n=1 Tax=Corynebacterium sp. TaxID=1720 RepID=UPI0026DF37F9|nr:N-acetylmuramoyl-L-alanine amidase [Corynebacterium sp.]MDO5511267.1 N-acetylmuramoyl-L-alanine amidase [Corynebacterium sp.]
MQQRRRIATGQTSVNPTLAVVLSLALIVSAAIGGNQILKTQDIGSGPIEVSQATESFASGDNVLIDDAAIAAQSGVPGPRTVKEFSRDEQFSMFAITWLDHRDLAAFVRAEMPDGSWGPWWDAEAIGELGPNGENGTELLYVEPTNKVQVSITGVDILGAPEQAPEADITIPEETPAEPAEAAEAAAQPVGAGLAPLPTNYGDIQPVADVAAPEDLDVVFIDGNAEAGGIALATDSVTRGMPPVVTRAGWGAPSGSRCGTTYDNSLQAAAVHHTAGSNNYTRAQAASIMRGMHNYHANTLRWCDLGYNAVVDKFGTIYEGRAGGLDRNVQGAHVGGFNRGTFGISMMGNYDITPTTPAMVRSVGEMIGWKAAIAGFNPQGSAPYTPSSFGGSKYSGGVTMTLPNVFAHRDAHHNACPGQYGYAQMGTIRAIAQEKVQQMRRGGGTTTTTPSATETTTVTTPPATETTTPPPATETTTVTTTPPPPAPAPAPTNNPLGLLGSAAGGDATSLLAIAGTLAGLAVAFLATEGSLPGTTQQVGDIEIMENVSLQDLKPVLDIVSTFASDPQINEAATRVGTTYGAALGDPRGGLNTPDATYALFDNGIIINEVDSTEARALWGVIGDLWAAQGFDLGPLGMPLNEEYNDGDLIRVDFEGGYVTFNPADGNVDVKLT